jgi:predicted RNA binding protein YcfA (HicA-like mRNA interferase family)
MPSKDLRQLIKQAEKQGWRVKVTGGNHLKWLPPRGQFVISSFSPSDPRAIKNLTKQLEKEGFSKGSR